MYIHIKYTKCLHNTRLNCLAQDNLQEAKCLTLRITCSKHSTFYILRRVVGRHFPKQSWRQLIEAIKLFLVDTFTDSIQSRARVFFLSLSFPAYSGMCQLLQKSDFTRVRLRSNWLQTFWFDYGNFNAETIMILYSTFLYYNSLGYTCTAKVSKTLL